MKSKFLNAICLPIRLFVSHKGLNKLGLNSLKDERYNIIRKHCKGKLLDIGCGDNQLVKFYKGEGIGVDVYDFGSGATIVKDSANLPFKDKSFDTISFVACLNHVPISKRIETLKEARRVLKDKGRIVLTMITPWVGIVRHKLDYWDPDQHQRGFGEGEEMGLSHEYIISLMKEAGFTLVKRKGFILNLNNLYIFKKARDY